MSDGFSVYTEHNDLASYDFTVESSEKQQNFFIARHFHQYPDTSFFMEQIDVYLTNTIKPLILDLNNGAASSRINYTNQEFNTNIIQVDWPVADCYYPFICF